MSADQAMVRGLRRLARYYLALALAFALLAIFGREWIFPMISSTTFGAAAFICHRKQKALVIAIINRKFGVTDE